jgi:hypothetical protein
VLSAVPMAEAVVDRWRLDQVVVVQDQHHLLGLGDQLVDQHGHHRLGRRLAALEQGLDPLTDPGPHSVQGGGDIAPEPRRVAVADIRRQPGHRLPAAPNPIAKQAGLAEAGRRTDQGEGTGRPLAEALQQPWADQEAGPGPGDVQLGRQQAVPLRRRSIRWRGRGRLSHGELAGSCHPTGAFPWRLIVVGGASRPSRGAKIPLTSHFRAMPPARTRPSVPAKPLLAEVPATAD